MAISCDSSTTKVMRAYLGWVFLNCRERLLLVMKDGSVLLVKVRKWTPKDTLVGFDLSFVCVAYELQLPTTCTVNPTQTHYYATFNSLSCYASLDTVAPCLLLKSRDDSLFGFHDALPKRPLTADATSVPLWQRHSLKPLPFFSFSLLPRSHPLLLSLTCSFLGRSMLKFQRTEA